MKGWRGTQCYQSEFLPVFSVVRSSTMSAGIRWFYGNRNMFTYTHTRLKYSTVRHVVHAHVKRGKVWNVLTERGKVWN